MSLFVKKSVASKISHVHCGALACGSAGLGNKGAIAVACEVNGKKIAVVNAHSGVVAALCPWQARITRLP